MKKLTYTANIQAPPEYVYNMMLGLDDIQTYQKWTTVFNPTSSWEGSWDKGNKILFIGVDDKGNRSGMVSRIAENIPGEFISIQHYGFLENNVEITEGPKVEGWKNALENYHFSPEGTGTLLTVELDSNDNFDAYFDEHWPKALKSLKDLCEGGQ